MSLFARNLAKYGKDVVFEDRDEKIINGQSSEVFSNVRDDRAIVKTLRGISVFDSTNTERVATHEMRLNYRDDIGAEQWVKRDGAVKRLKILTAENCCENDTVLVLMCTERGDDSKVVNSA
jgi:head-tail adaptor